MTNIAETGNYDAGVYQWATGDAVLGGAGGIAVAPIQNLANRTGWLKAQIANLTGNLSGYALINSPSFTGTPTAPTPAIGDNSGALVTTNFLARSGPVITNNGGQLTTISTPYGVSTNACVAYQKSPNGRIEFYFHNIVFTGYVTTDGGAKVIFAVVTLPFTLPNGVLSACFMTTDIGGNVHRVTGQATLTLVASGQSQVVLAAQGPSVDAFNNISISGFVVGF